MKSLLGSLALLAALLALRAWRLSPASPPWNPLPHLAWLHGSESQAARAEAAFLQEIRALRLADASFQRNADTAPEMAVWRRQFPSDAERQYRLAAAGFDEAAFEHEIRDHLLDEAWLARHLARSEPAVDEAAARAWYRQHFQRLRIPQAHHAAHIFLSRRSGKSDRRAELTALRLRLRNGELWETLTAAHSEDARTRSHGGDLGWFTAARMPADFMRIIEILTPGSTCGAVETELGWHIIHLRARRPARLPSYEEVRLEILAALRTQARLQALDNLRARIPQAPVHSFR